MTPAIPLAFYHVTPTKNLDLIKKHGLLPQCGPRAKAMCEPQKSIYLLDSKRTLEDASWIEEAFGNEPLVVLKIDPAGVQKPTPTFQDLTSWEWTTTAPIYPNYIEVTDIPLE